MGSARIGVCASTGRMATHFSASRCEPSGATPDGGESKDTPPKYTKIRHSEGEATKSDAPRSDPL